MITIANIDDSIEDYFDEGFSLFYKSGKVILEGGGCRGLIIELVKDRFT